MHCRIHRSSPTAVDVDFQITDALIVTAIRTDHTAAVEIKRQFDAATEAEQKG